MELHRLAPVQQAVMYREALPSYPGGVAWTTGTGSLPAYKSRLRSHIARLREKNGADAYRARCSDRIGKSIWGVLATRSVHVTGRFSFVLLYSFRFGNSRLNGNKAHVPKSAWHSCAQSMVWQQPQNEAMFFNSISPWKRKNGKKHIRCSFV